MQLVGSIARFGLATNLLLEFGGRGIYVNDGPRVHVGLVGILRPVIEVNIRGTRDVVLLEVVWVLLGDEVEHDLTQDLVE